MYKTVRHGENSLQYTILPQEEGLANVKPRKTRKKGKTAAILTVTVILICGIIATAVLVPLLLTSDLVVLPAAFQKFSVSSLHRTHSGNHVVVVAKKPHGWINTHHNPAHPPGANKTYNNAIKSLEEALNSTTKTTSTTTTTTARPTTSPATTTTPRTTKSPQPTPGTRTTTMSNEIVANVMDGKASADATGVRMYERNKFTEVPLGRSYLDISTTTRSSKGNEFSGDGVVRLLNTEIRTTSRPWYDQRWSFGNTVSYVPWSRNDTEDNFVTIMVGGAIVLLCLIIIFVVWMRRRRNLRKDVIKNSTDAKADDKDTLLKESAGGSEEE